MNNIDPDGMDIIYGVNSITYTGADAQSALAQLKSEMSSNQGNQGDDQEDTPKKKVYKISELYDVPEQIEPLTDNLSILWDRLNGGRNINDILYGSDGKILGLAPRQGTPGFIGGPLANGDKAIKLGRILLNPKYWHQHKEAFKALVGESKFVKTVGSNPDISFKGTKITLTGARNSPFRGKSYETNYSIADFTKWIMNR